jgi:hypothetical protein
MQLRGSTQIIAGTITADRLVAGFNLPLSQLLGGTDILKRDGSVALIANLPAGGFTISGLGAPSSATDAATKGYVDSVASGLDAKASVRVATTGNILLTGTQTIDGVALSVGDRVLVKSQTLPIENGIYTVSSGVWSRATDADSNNEVSSGMFAFVEEGTTNSDTGWVLSTDGSVNLGVTALSFVKFSSAASLTAGAGLLQTGTTFDIVAADNSLTINADSLQVKRDSSGAIGLGVNGIGVSVDGVSVEINSNALRLASGAAGSGIGYSSGVLNVNVNANGGIQTVSDALEIKLDGSSLSLSSSGIRIANIAAGSILMGNASGAPTATALSGDISVTSGGVVSLAADVIRNADYVAAETLTGVPNGVLTAFTILATPVAGTVKVYINGILQKPTTDYSISGTTITFTSAPLLGDWLSATYIK